MFLRMCTRWDLNKHRIWRLNL